MSFHLKLISELTTIVCVTGEKEIFRYKLSPIVFAFFNVTSKAAMLCKLLAIFRHNGCFLISNFL